MTRTWRFGTRWTGITGVVCLLLGGTKLHAVSPVRWAVCYSEDADVAALADYDVVVLDALRHPSLTPLLERKRTVLAYLSLTEMVSGHHAFQALSDAGVLLDAHPGWPGTHFLDFRRPEWRQLVLDRLVPDALASGFSGLFLDTLDDAAFLEAQDAERYAGMRDGAIALVRAIRARYPHIVLMANRGFDLMADVAPSLDIVLGESVVARFTGDGTAYERRSDDEIAWQVNALQAAKSRNERLQLFTLDYWDPTDRDGVQRIYEEQRARGFSPYVSTRALDRVVEEPR